VLTILDQLICRVIANVGTQCSNQPTSTSKGPMHRCHYIAFQLLLVTCSCMYVRVYTVRLSDSCCNTHKNWWL